MTIAQHNLDTSPGSGSRTALADNAETDIETHSINGAAATTFHPSDVGGQQRGKWDRLWKMNAGLDSHRANGEHVNHAKLAKVNENAREKRRLAETFASRLELPRHRIEAASDLAAETDARGFTLWGGRQAVAVAAVQAVAPFDVYLGHNPERPEGADTVDRDGENADIRREIKDRLGASDVQGALERLDKATEKIKEVSA